MKTAFLLGTIITLFVCSNGNDERGDRDISCGDPGSLKNGRRSGYIFTFPSKVEYECNEGYTLVGNKRRYCQVNGAWTGQRPFCKANDFSGTNTGGHRVGIPPAPLCTCEYVRDSDNLLAYSNGRLLGSKSTVELGQYITFRCKRVGYHRFEGQRELQCTNCEPWTPFDLPKCTDPPPGDVAIYIRKDSVVLKDGSLEVIEGQDFGLSCASTSAEHPSFNVTDGPRVSRKYKEKVCKGTTYYITKLQIKNAKEEDSGFYACERNGSPPVIIHIIVKEGISCSLNSLIAQLPAGVYPTRPDLGEIPLNSLLTLDCDEVFKGNRSAQCGADAKWHLGDIKCEKGCRPVAIPPSSQLMASPKKKIYASGELLYFTCPKNYEPENGLEVVVCVGGQWLFDALPECKLAD